MLLGERAAALVTAAVDRHHRLALVALIGAWLAGTAVAAAAKPFWHDEIYTILLAQLPSTGAVWAAMADGTDLSAPLNTLLTRGVHALFGVGRITTRIPALSGTALMITMLFLFVRRRAGTILAVAGVVLVSSTAAYRFAYEARGYGLMQGAFALALFAWAEAASGRRRAFHLPLMTIALASAFWSHYFGVFALAPIGAGEIVRVARRRRPDAGVWTAAAISLLAFVPLLPLLNAARSQSAHYWSQAALSDARATYSFLLHEVLHQQVIVPALLAAGLVALRWLTRAPAAERRRLPAHEVAAIGTCLLLPLIEIAAARLTSGVFVPRYALPFTFGVGIAIPLGIWRLTAGATSAQIVFALLLTSGFGSAVYQSVVNRPQTFVSPVDQRPVLASALQEPQPVVVTGGLMFLQLWYDTPPAVRARLWYVADSDSAVTYTGSDTIRSWAAGPCRTGAHQRDRLRHFRRAASGVPRIHRGFRLGAGAADARRGGD